MIKKIDQYFFKEESVLGICIFRILVGLYALISFMRDLLSIETFYSVENLETSLLSFNGSILNIFQYFPDSLKVVYLFSAIYFVSLVSFTVGFKTRFFSIFSFILMTSFHQRNIDILNSSDLLLRILMLYMIFSPAMKALSVDAYLKRKKGAAYSKEHAPWVHRLIQIQVSVVYLTTIYSKLKGQTWLDGSAVYYSTRLIDFARFTIPYLMDSIIFLKLMTWMTLFIETLLGCMILFSKYRKYIIYLGIIFHLGIEYLMTIPGFEWLMIICLLAMFPLNEYKELLSKLKQ